MSNILIVDDDFNLRQSFEKILTEEGHVSGLLVQVKRVLR